MLQFSDGACQIRLDVCMHMYECFYCPVTDDHCMGMQRRCKLHLLSGLYVSFVLQIVPFDVFLPSHVPCSDPFHVGDLHRVWTFRDSEPLFVIHLFRLHDTGD